MRDMRWIRQLAAYVLERPLLNRLGFESGEEFVRLNYIPPVRAELLEALGVSPGDANLYSQKGNVIQNVQ